MAGRVIQGLAASVYVVILASMRDCFDDPASRQQAMGRMLFLMQIGPIFAPVVGGFLASAFGWRFPFGLLALLAVLAACVSWQVFHETAAARPQCNNLAAASAILVALIAVHIVQFNTIQQPRGVVLPFRVASRPSEA